MIRGLSRRIRQDRPARYCGGRSRFRRSAVSSPARSERPKGWLGQSAQSMRSFSTEPMRMTSVSAKSTGNATARHRRIASEGQHLLFEDVGRPAGHVGQLDQAPDHLGGHPLGPDGVGAPPGEFPRGLDPHPRPEQPRCERHYSPGGSDFDAGTLCRRHCVACPRAAADPTRERPSGGFRRRRDFPARAALRPR